jgi:hypothetical protein
MKDCWKHAEMVLSACASRSIAENPAVEKNFRVARVKGDGRCMFRAMALGLAYNKGHFLSKELEEKEAGVRHVPRLSDTDFVQHRNEGSAI